LLKELDTKLCETVRQLAATFKKGNASLNKKCKKLASDVTKAAKEVTNLDERLKKIESKTLTPKKKRRRPRNADERQAERSRRRRVKPVEELAQENTQRVVSRPPTPMVPPMNGRSWWGGHGVAQQAYVGSDVAPRRVNTTPPTPHFISPVYASRNFIR